MCGIAGILFKKQGSRAEVGKALIDMLDGCQHRGPDSTGFALYHDAAPGTLSLPPIDTVFSVTLPLSHLIHCGDHLLVCTAATLCPPARCDRAGARRKP